MINDIQIITKSTKTTEENTVVVKVGPGKSGQPTVIPPKRAASKSRINTSPAFSAGRVSLLKPSYAFALE